MSNRKTSSANPPRAARLKIEAGNCLTIAVGKSNPDDVADLIDDVADLIDEAMRLARRARELAGPTNDVPYGPDRPHARRRGA